MNTRAARAACTFRSDITKAGHPAEGARPRTGGSRSRAPQRYPDAVTAIRVARRKRWTTVDRELVNDKRLSFMARGILTWLLDKPDDWETSNDQIESESPSEGRVRIRSALKELEDAGYLERKKYRGADGRWCKEWLVHELHQGTESSPGRVPHQGTVTAGGAPRVETVPTNRGTETENGEQTTEVLPPADAGTLPGLAPKRSERSQRSSLPLVAQAHEMTTRVFADRKPKPLPAFLNVRSLAVRALECGWPADELERAMMRGDTVFTLAGLETARAKAAQEQPDDTIESRMARLRAKGETA